jgi:predicted dehydrogenase
MKEKVKLFAPSKAGIYSPQPPHYNTNRMYIDEMKHFFDCLDGKSQPMQDIKAAKNVLRIALTARESSETGKAIRLKEFK